MSLYDRDYMREDPGDRAARGLSAFGVVLGLNAIVFVFQFIFEIGWLRHPLTGELLMPLGGVSAHELARGHYWTLFTYMFVHGSVGHFLLNMLMLWFAGRGVQHFFGNLHFTLIYFASGIAGAAAEMAVNGFVHGDTVTPLIGASASVFGLLTALATVIPEQKITAFIYFIIPVHLRMWTLVKGLCVIQLVLGLLGAAFDFLPEGLRIAYFAHLGGALAGWLYAGHLGYGGRTMRYARQWQPPGLENPRSPVLARKRLKPVLDLEAGPDDEDAAGNAADPIQCLMDEVNPILEKIKKHGMESLSPEEKLRLEHASREVKRHHDALGGL
ncbi:MAG: rhomboid family intramembrane serine protease [Prosthecobacter sp.]